MTKVTHKLFEALTLGLGCLMLLPGCAPRVDRVKREQQVGTYFYTSNRLFEDDGDFDIRYLVTYEQVKHSFNPETNVSNRQLTEYRCLWCHECGFRRAWDYDNVGKPEWRPRYRGEQWAIPVQRMRRMDGSMLNELIADRIYSYLKEESLGRYDESQDSKGAIVRIVDELPEEIRIESPGSAQKRRAAEGQRQSQQDG